MPSLTDRITSSWREEAQQMSDFNDAFERCLRDWRDNVKRGVTMDDYVEILRALEAAERAGVDQETLEPAHKATERVWQLAVRYDRERIIMLGGDPARIPDRTDRQSESAEEDT